MRVGAWLGAISALVLSAPAGCGGSQPAVEDADVAPAPSPGPTVARAAWGTAPPVGFDRAVLSAELARSATEVRPSAAMDGPSAGSLADMRATWSLARIGGLAARDRLGEALGSSLDDSTVAVAAAALALLDASDEDPAWRNIEDALWTRYAVTEDGDAATALLFAIARLGGSRSVSRLAVELAPSIAHADGDAALRRREDALTGLGIACARGQAVDDPARDAIAQSLEATRTEERVAAAYALGRCARVSAESLAVADERKVIVGRVTRSLGASAEYDRMAWIALRTLGDLPDPLPEEILGADPPPWTTEVEAVRAFAQTAAGREALVERLATLGPDAVAGARGHVIREALEALRPHARRGPGPVGTDRLEPIVAALDRAHDSAAGRPRKALALARCEARTLEAIATGALDRIASCGDPKVAVDPVSTLEVEALLAMSDAAMSRAARVDALLERAASPRSRVAGPALSALAEIDDPRAIEVLHAALGRDDPGLAAAAAGALAARSVDAGKRSLDVVPGLRRTITERTNGEAVEARLMAIEALGVLAAAPERGIDPEGRRSPDRPDAPWLESVVLPLARDPSVAIRAAARRALGDRPGLVERFDTSGPVAGRDAFAKELDDRVRAWMEEPIDGVRVVTEAGAFVIDFRGYATPINHANFVGLAREGFYEGVPIHRVEPGFVIQGGDPRGDGYGGPGYLVPCEWSNHRYVRGSVGIALAGKDTGGSQWFVTQTPQPHLDGRYTQIGIVVEGMDVVDAILPGDAIVRVEPITTLPPVAAG